MRYQEYLQTFAYGIPGMIIGDLAWGGTGTDSAGIMIGFVVSAIALPELVEPKEDNAPDHGWLWRWTRTYPELGLGGVYFLSRANGVDPGVALVLGLVGAIAIDAFHVSLYRPGAVYGKKPWPGATGSFINRAADENGQNFLSLSKQALGYPGQGRPGPLKSNPADINTTKH
jgi:hypothetical protein